MVGAEAFSNPSRVFQLAVIVVIESYRESLCRPRRHLAHEGDHGTRINPAGQESAQGNIGHQSRAHGIPDQLNSTLPGILFVNSYLAGEVKRPVLLDPRFAIRPEQQMSRLELLNSREGGSGGGHTGK